MAVNIKNCYLFLLDNVNQAFMPTEQTLDPQVDGAYHFIEKNIEKCMKNVAGRPATFKKNSEIKETFLDYKVGNIPLLEFANEIASKRFDFKEMYEIFTISNLFICVVTIQEVEYVIGIELTSKEAMITTQKSEPGLGIRNNITVKEDIVPPSSLSNTCFFMIEVDKMKLTILEKMISTVDDDTYLYADKILECDTEFSIKEIVGKVRRATEDAVNEYELDKLEVIPTLNKALLKEVNSGERIDIESVINEALFNKPEAVQFCIKKIEGHEIEKFIANENRVKIPLQKNMKLKTDTGIEITVPIDYYHNKEFIEILNTEEGRLYIQIKNVGNIESN